LCILAGDISPIDVLSHIPVLCEEKEVDYVFVSSKELLGTASLTKRPTSCVLVNIPPESPSHEKYMVCVNEAKTLITI